ncbi:hypothetical protein CEP53_005150 [Fusarium sp. AF-6]|nr:hypothetical protein CEP53_005150 [Fusarium sp. AF-6]
MTMAQPKLWSAMAWAMVLIANVIPLVAALPKPSAVKSYNLPRQDGCDPSENTYGPPPDREGEFGRAISQSGRQYITIVNLTPHRFRLQDSHEHQMRDWDWGDIEPGRARQNVAHYSEKVTDWLVDTKGEAYYDVGDTGAKFVVRATNNVKDIFHNKRFIFDLTGMNAGAREYKAPGPEIPVTLVITGSVWYGFVTSIHDGPYNWMGKIKDTIGDRTVSEIVMPGTHDSGMSRISRKVASFGIEHNTQTQSITVGDQLWAGARWLDVRVISVHVNSDIYSYEFWTWHGDPETAFPIGNTGESLNEVIDGINSFTSQNPGEVIFIQLRYLLGLRQFPLGGPVYWPNELKDDFFEQLKRINNRCANLGEKNLEQLRMSELMEWNEGKGCVLLFLDTAALEKRIIKEHVISRPDGIYHRNDMDWDDAWPDRMDEIEASARAVELWKGRTKPFHVGQWVVTGDLLTGLSKIAESMNTVLYWRGVNQITPQVFPNVLLVDYIGEVVQGENAWKDLSLELKTLAIGLNLYTISENCAINHRRSPLLEPISGQARLSGEEQRFPAWNGVIFANGTVLDEAPPDLRLGCVEILKKGTKFDNGTVLEQDMRNPECQGKPVVPGRGWNSTAALGTYRRGGAL